MSEQEAEKVNPKKSPDDVRFLINTLSLAFVIVAIIVAFQPYIEDDPRLNEIKAVERDIINVAPADLPHMVKSDKHPEFMLVGYASWCQYCRQVVPLVVDMVRNNRMGDIQPVFVSLDDQPRKFSKYLVHNEYHKVVYPYVVGYGFSQEIAEAMRPTGSSFNGTIPYVGFFHNGRLQVESVGIISQSKLEDMVQQAKNSH